MASFLGFTGYIILQQFKFETDMYEVVTVLWLLRYLCTTSYTFQFSYHHRKSTYPEVKAYYNIINDFKK